jgi:3-phosphoshikimate 1-carboxyvinyltransferase
MNKAIYPFSYKGRVCINSSKSYFQRALALSCLTQSNSLVLGSPNEEDIKIAIDICRHIGMDLNVSDNFVKVIGSFSPKTDTINFNSGESGLCTRMFGVILSSFYEKTIIQGKGTILSRKTDFSCLKQLGVQVKSTDFNFPVILDGRLSSGIIDLDCSNGSQLLTGLLMVLPFVKGDSILNVTGLVSRPYIDMTIDILKNFGIKVINNDYKKFIIPGNQKSIVSKYEIEGDWSGAAFHLVGAAISGVVDVYGLNIKSLQADKAIVDALELCGADITIDNDFIRVKKKDLNSFSFDATHCPDLFPPLVVLAASCKGTSIIDGVNRLTNKESNRSLTLQKEFEKIGVHITLDGNRMLIEGTDNVSGGEVESHNDHRIAMALSIMACVASSSITIKDANAVAKSYSNFYIDLERVGS